MSIVYHIFNLFIDLLILNEDQTRNKVIYINILKENSFEKFEYILI